MVRSVTRGWDCNLMNVVIFPLKRAPALEEGAGARLVLHISLVRAVEQPTAVLSKLDSIELGLDSKPVRFNDSALGVAGTRATPY